MLTSEDLEWMYETENNAMASTAKIYRLSQGMSILGPQDDSYTLSSTVACDLWAINVNAQMLDSNETIEVTQYYLSVPYDTDVRLSDVIVVDNAESYSVLTVPDNETWLTNLRLRVKNYNKKLQILD